MDSEVACPSSQVSAHLHGALINSQEIIVLELFLLAAVPCSGNISLRHFPCLWGRESSSLCLVPGERLLRLMFNSVCRPFTQETGLGIGQGGRGWRCTWNANVVDLEDVYGQRLWCILSTFQGLVWFRGFAWKTSSHFREREARAVSVCFVRGEGGWRMKSSSPQPLLHMGEMEPLVWRDACLVSSTQAASVRSKGADDTGGGGGQANWFTPVCWPWKQKVQ